jgi:murein DD-endopeptidase MepM/ murein hydrolase activator NlpD
VKRINAQSYGIPAILRCMLLFVLVSSCRAESRESAVRAEALAAEVVPVAADTTVLAASAPSQTASLISCTVLPPHPRPGEPVTVWVVPHLSSNVETARIKQAALFADEARLSLSSFFTVPAAAEDEQPLMAAVLAIPSTAASGFASIRMLDGEETLADIPIIIAEREFVSEEIELDQGLTNIRTVPDPRKTAESELLWTVLSKTGTGIYCMGNFIPPVASTRRTSFFGDRRVYKYSNGGRDTAIHAGVDYGVPTGTPVFACGNGRVVLARPRIVTGNSVVIEHLPGIYSLYYHLDKIEAVEGAMTAAGDRIGLSGATGLATGPHLHWEIRVSGENTDPDAFTARPVLDKDAILAKINDNSLWTLTVLERR